MNAVLTSESKKAPEADAKTARWLAYANGWLWAVGNGLATSTLVTTLAREYGAQGVAVSLILAAPNIVGVLRQATPRLMRRWAGRKSFCIAMYLLSAAVLFALPAVAAPQVLPTPRWSLVALVTLWCGYQLLEYFATVALWSWLGDIAPEVTRGTFLGRREAWLSAGRLVGMLASGLFTFYWPDWMSRATLWQAYSLCSMAGALVMLLAALLLVWLPSFETKRSLPEPLAWRAIFFAPLGDRRFQRLIAFGCWLGAVNGLLGASQFLYGRSVLQLSLLVMLAMRAEAEIGQTIVSSSVGRWVDRIGNKRVMICSQLLVALAMVFYLVARPDSWWLLFGAWACFIAYAGLNVGIPNLMLKLAPHSERNAYIASHYAWAGVAYGLGSLSGGALFDLAAKQHWSWEVGAWRLDHFALFFAAGLVLRACGALWIAAIPEERST